MFDDEVVETQEVVEEVVEAPAEEVVEAAPIKQKTEPAESFKIVRERALKAERERDEMARRLHEMENHTHEPEEDLEFSLGADELAEGKHLSKVDKKVKKIEAELQKYKNLAEQNAIRAELVRKHPDFDDIVSEANLEKLKEQDPDLFETLNMSNANLLKKGATAYKMIKNSGILERDEFQPERQIAEKNLAKPRPLISGASQRGDTPLSQANAFANGLTPELKQKLWQEMKEAQLRR